jgi:hypothetical protein
MKTVSFKMPAQAANAHPADAWVKSRDATPEIPAPAAAPVPTEPMKRFTIDVPESLHTRIKSQCALKRLKMADVLRDLLEREFPADAKS